MIRLSVRTTLGGPLDGFSDAYFGSLGAFAGFGLTEMIESSCRSTSSTCTASGRRPWTRPTGARWSSARTSVSDLASTDAAIGTAGALQPIGSARAHSRTSHRLTLV